MTGSQRGGAHALADFTADARMLRLILSAAVIGFLSALTARALESLIAVLTNLAFFHRFSAAPASPARHQLGAWVVAVPIVGALLIGLMARFGSSKIRGHGIPEAIEAILLGRSRIQPKVAAWKLLSSAVSIGTGGPFGAEGPIIMTGGAVGSLFAQFFHLTSSERKTLLVAGAAGGMSAIFASPVAAVLLAVELLLFEWKPRSLIPVACSASVAAAARLWLMGAGPVFPVADRMPSGAWALAAALAVGVASGLASGLLTAWLYAVEDFFAKLPVHWMWWPALGAVVVGLGGWLDPRVLGVGYENIARLLHGDLVGGTLVALLVGKALVWSIALGSGTSGGVLAPLLIIGGALGAVAGRWIPIGDPGLWALQGMAAMMGGTMRAPLTAVVFALELTHAWSAMPALLVASMAAYAVTVLMMRRSILTEKIARRGHHLTREYTVDLLRFTRVKEAMDADPPLIGAGRRVASLAEAMTSPKDKPRHGAWFIVADDGSLRGVITHGDVLRSLERDPQGRESVEAAGNREPMVTAHPDEVLEDALIRMLDKDIGRLPVTDGKHPGKPLGYLGRTAILAAYRGRIAEERVRERGLIDAE